MATSSVAGRVGDEQGARRTIMVSWSMNRMPKSPMVTKGSHEMPSDLWAGPSRWMGAHILRRQHQTRSKVDATRAIDRLEYLKLKAPNSSRGHT